MRAWYAFSAAAALTATGFAFAQDDGDPQRLRSAQSEAKQSEARAEAFERQAAQATDQAARARAESEALVARIEASEADITAAEARTHAIDAMLSGARARLAERQGPLIRLIAALQTMARRPPALALMQPGSLDDAVRVRAVLASTLPRIQQRTAALRADVDRAATLRAQQAQAGQALVASRTELASRREALARFEGEQRARSQSMTALALRESDRAIAMGEEARTIERQVNDAGYRDRLAAQLGALPGPVQRPGAAPVASPHPFILPLSGRLIEGVGELNDAGVHARGLVLEAEPGTQARAPAPGRVAFAGRFRGYDLLVIIDHGDGWTSVVTNLAGLDVAQGQRVERGAVIGRTGSARSRVTVELRYQGRPVPITSLLAS
jgi:murein hydrolase activator